MRFSSRLLFGLFLAAAIFRGGAGERRPEVFDLGGLRARLIRFDNSLLVESDYTKRFKFDSADNPKLKELRERYRLAEVISPGRDEFDQQVLLMDWAHHQFKKFGAPSMRAQGALEILEAIREGNTFFCTQYAEVLVSCAASLGWIDRPLALRRHQGVARDGSSEHSTTEIWSNQFAKWIMLDPTGNMYLEKKGVPLGAYEIRQEWFYHGGTNLTFVVGKERKRYTKRDLPVRLEHFAGFGDLSINPDELDKYGFTGYIPNTDLMDSPFDYAQMFILKDALCQGTRWHERINPANPEADAYFPIGQAALQIAAEEDHLRVRLKTFTPNFGRFEAKTDAGEWIPVDAAFPWRIHPGTNRLQVRTRNRFGVTGPVSIAEIKAGS